LPLAHVCYLLQVALPSEVAICDRVWVARIAARTELPSD
jgi:hypothetical protein